MQSPLINIDLKNTFSNKTPEHLFLQLCLGRSCDSKEERVDKFLTYITGTYKWKENKLTRPILYTIKTQASKRRNHLYKHNFRHQFHITLDPFNTSNQETCERLFQNNLPPDNSLQFETYLNIPAGEKSSPYQIPTIFTYNPDENPVLSFKYDKDEEKFVTRRNKKTKSLENKIS